MSKRLPLRLVAVVAAVSLAFPAASLAAAAPSPSPSASSSNGAGKSGEKQPPRATWGIAPATPGQQDTRTSFGYRFAPGFQYDDNFVVFNNARKPVSLQLLAADLINAADGSISAGVDSKTARDAGKWITIKHAPQVTVPAATAKAPGAVIVPFHIQVPKDAVPGDHGAVVMAALVSAAKGQGTTVELNQRVGARISIRVPGDLKPALAVQDLKVDYTGTWNPLAAGKATISYTVANVGNTFLGARQNVRIDGWFGSGLDVPAARTPDITTLVPGGKAKVTVQVDGVWPSLMRHAHVHLTPMVQATDKDLPVKPVDASASFWAIPWVDFVILLALILIVLARWMLVRRGRGRGKGNGGGAPDGPKGPSGGGSGEPVGPRELERTT